MKHHQHHCRRRCRQQGQGQGQQQQQQQNIAFHISLTGKKTELQFFLLQISDLKPEEESNSSRALTPLKSHKITLETLRGTETLQKKLKVKIK